MVELTTERLRLRGWRPQDRVPFAALNADPEVMRHFPAPLDRHHSDQLLDAVDARLTEFGWGLWALEQRASGEFLGMVGLAPVSFAAAFTPAVEVGWRLARPSWGHGYATEAARASISFAFCELSLGEVVSFTFVGNTRSRAVMRRLGMTHDARGDFDHPYLPEGSPLRPHVLYRLAAPGPARAGAGAD